MLSLASLLYGWIIGLRNAFFDRGFFKSKELGARTISVGNLTTGGTGKTPLVAYIATLLAARGEKVCVISRGYGRANENRRVLVSDGNKIFADAIESGDEPLELARRLIGKAMVVADADRVGSADWAKAEYGITAFVLDDAFQHRRARRDLDIVCIDATNPFGGDNMLPAGRLREPVTGLKRAAIAVITRSNLVDDTSGLRHEISRIAPEIQVFTATGQISGIRSLDHSTNLDRRKPLFAFCALGNPENFYQQLNTENLKIVANHSFPDHHFYTQRDIEILEIEAKQQGSEALITTAKDAVKLTTLRFNLTCFVAELELEISDAERFGTLV